MCAAGFISGVRCIDSFFDSSQCTSWDWPACRAATPTIQRNLPISTRLQRLALSVLVKCRCIFCCALRCPFICLRVKIRAKKRPPDRGKARKGLNGRCPARPLFILLKGRQWSSKSEAFHTATLAAQRPLPYYLYRQQRRVLPVRRCGTPERIWMNVPQHSPDYFVPSMSWHPARAALALLGVMFSLAGWINGQTWAPIVFSLSLAALACVLWRWFGDAIAESERGLYGKRIDASYRWSMSGFIFSEVMFFSALFGALFYARAVVAPMLADFDHKLLWPEFSALWPNAGPAELT